MPKTLSHSPVEEADRVLAAATAKAALRHGRNADAFLDALMPTCTEPRTRRPYENDKGAEMRERNREASRRNRRKWEQYDANLEAAVALLQHTLAARAAVLGVPVPAQSSGESRPAPAELKVESAVLLNLPWTFCLAALASMSLCSTPGWTCPSCTTPARTWPPGASTTAAGPRSHPVLPRFRSPTTARPL